MSEHTCAVWWVRSLSPSYELFESEADAAAFAVRLENAEDGAVVGIQFADGRTVWRDDWQAYHEAEARMGAPWHDTRQVRDPFGYGAVTVDADEPDWLGAPGAEGRTA